VQLPAAAYDSPSDRLALYDALQQRLAALDGVQSVSMAAALPLNGGETRPLAIMGRPAAVDPKDQPSTLTIAISADYFGTLGLPLTRGRGFTGADGGPGQDSAIVNERFVERFLPDRDPIGQKIALTASAPGPAEWLTVTGVAPSIRQRPSALPDPVVYVPLRWAPPARLSLLVRSDVDRAALTDRLRREVLALDAALPLDRVRTMPQALRDGEWVGRVSRQLVTTLTFIAVLLAAFGLAAVTSYGVSQRAQEISVRLALGASRWQIVRFVGRRVVFQLAIGALTGLVCTRIWAALFASGSAGVTASDVRSGFLVLGILAAVAILACALPVRRALRVDPVSVLRRQ
jgi:putative ABC transport system permease protein